VTKTISSELVSAFNRPMNGAEGKPVVAATLIDVCVVDVTAAVIVVATADDE
jgi:hypothetical protein